MFCLSPRRQEMYNTVCEPLLADWDRGEKYSVSASPVSEDELQTRLRDLRDELTQAKVDWYVVPSEDEHQSEEVGNSEKRREFMSGFTGSAGTALIPSSMDTKALLFVDSRYYIQAERQIPKTGWEVRRVGAAGGTGGGDVVQGWVDWLVKDLDDGTRVGIDPKLISLELAQSIISRLESSDSSTQLVPLSSNLVDKIRDTPPRSLGPLLPYPLNLSGEDTPSKLSKIRGILSDRLSFTSSRSNASSTEWIYLLPTLPAIAWFLNYRCPTDIPFCPVAYAYLALTPSKCVIFVDERKLTNTELKERWEEEGIEVRKYGTEEVGKFVKEFDQELRRLHGDKKKVKIWGPKECNWALGKASSPANIETILCPVETVKAVKNPTEQQNFRNAYLRDGRAMVRWMYWLEQKIVKDQRRVGEWAAAQALTGFRRREEMFAGLAYDDISASGPNAALPHYVPARGADALIDIDAPYVIDSGAQYQDGTIDTTRTLYLGKTPPQEVKRAYTRVLQGHMAVSASVFPMGMPSDHLIMLAKDPLYKDGLDFGHGLGHGIGSYLAVHEWPSPYPHTSSFVPGHVTTIEPGFYKEGEFGIRIESVILCKKVETENEFGGHRWLGWERITQVPIQTSLVDFSLLSKPEIRWLNEHNTSVLEALTPLLQEEEDGEVLKWLKNACKPHKIWPWTGL